MNPEPETKVANPCNASTKAGKPCRTFAGYPDGRCFFHSAHVTPEQRSAAGRAGAASTNHAATVRKLERDTQQALQAQQAATEALRPQALALVAGGDGVDVSTPEAVQAVVSKALGAVLGGTLPPSQAKAVTDLLRVRIELASLAISERLMKLERALQDRQGNPQQKRRGRR